MKNIFIETDSQIRDIKLPKSNLSKLYKSVLEKITSDVSTLSNIETVMIQQDSRKNLTKNIKLSLVRDNYIYARIPFFRTNKKYNDIRCIVGHTKDHGSNLDTLLQDQNFVKMCTQKLGNKIDKEITKTINEYNLPI